MLRQNFANLLTISLVLFFSCNSSDSTSSDSATSLSKQSAETGIPERYLLAAKEFCDCHGEWLQIQYDGEMAKKNQDIAKMTELGELLKSLPDRTECTKTVNDKMELFEKEDGPDVMNDNFDKAAAIHCPIFIQILDLAEQVEDVG